MRTICFWLFFTAGLIASANANELFVSAAASFEKQTGTKIVLNLGPSSMLARQIEEGAPADVFISADEAQTDRLHKQIAPETRKDLLMSNHILRRDLAERTLEPVYCYLIIPSEGAEPPAATMDFFENRRR